MNQLAFIPFAFFTFIFTSFFHIPPVSAEKPSLTESFSDFQACGCNQRTNKFQKIRHPR